MMHAADLLLHGHGHGSHHGVFALPDLTPSLRLCAPSTMAVETDRVERAAGKECTEAAGHAHTIHGV